MTDTAEAIRQILEQRMHRVGEVSILNADLLRKTQEQSGLRVDLMRCEDGAAAGSDLARDERNRIRDDTARLETEIGECERKRKALEDRISQLDRKLEGL